MGESGKPDNLELEVPGFLEKSETRLEKKSPKVEVSRWGDRDVINYSVNKYTGPGFIDPVKIRQSISGPSSYRFKDADQEFEQSSKVYLFYF